MKTLILTLSILLLISIITLTYIIGYNDNKTDLEIYTSDNIYYIKGLKVSEEKEFTVTEFKDKQSLKDFISEVTAMDSKNTLNN